MCKCTYGFLSLYKVAKFSTSWSYNRKELVIDDISFTMRGDSHILAIVGPVGSGKVCIVTVPFACVLCSANECYVNKF